MEPVGLAVGISGLAGLFTSCLEVIENIDSYRDFGLDSRALAAQFDADRLRFDEWGQAVGIKHGKLSEDHHRALDDPRKLSMTKELLYLIKQISGDSDDALTQHEFFSLAASKRQKIAWALRGKRKRTAQVEQFGSLVQHLHTLIPPDPAQGELATRHVRLDSRSPSVYHVAFA
ncbi:prion-inhibition and propagation-domain-containing protein [Ilyonectria destructans]|nr:prion-inhibition and propagation-domain-containing protein [Ilyonectria destructans]